MRETADSLTLYTHTSLPEAYRMAVSDATAFFEGKPYGDWKKGREAEMKAQVAVIDRLNNVIRACGIVAKTVAKSAR